VNSFTDPNVNEPVRRYRGMNGGMMALLAGLVATGGGLGLAGCQDDGSSPAEETADAVDDAADDAADAIGDAADDAADAIDDAADEIDQQMPSGDGGGG
jgi:hypothetical protein